MKGEEILHRNDISQGIHPIHILHMIGSLNVGGSQAFILNIYKNIDRSKVQFDFILDHKNETALVSEVTALGAKIYVVPQFTGTNISSVSDAWEKLFAEHPEYKILHSHVRSYASIFLPIAKKHGVVTIMHSHSTSNGTGMLAIVKYFLQLPIRWQADYLFACSNKTGKWLYGKDVYKKENFRIFPNAIDFNRFSFNDEKRNKMRQELHLNNQLVIGHVGRFVKPKNHIFLLKIFAEFHQRHPNSRLLLVGDGPLKTQLLQSAKKFGIYDTVLFVGARSNVEDYYQAMDMFVFPSLWEGFPVSVVEAYINGLSIIVSDCLAEEFHGSERIKSLPLRRKQLWIRNMENAGQRIGIPNVIANTENSPFQQYNVIHAAQKLQEFYLNIKS